MPKVAFRYSTSPLSHNNRRSMSYVCTPTGAQLIIETKSLQEVLKGRPDDLAVKKELSMCYTTFQEYFEDISKVVPAAVQNEKGFKSSPPGWQESSTLGNSADANNQNNTRAAALLKKLVSFSLLSGRYISCSLLSYGMVYDCKAKFPARLKSRTG